MSAQPGDRAGASSSRSPSPQVTTAPSREDSEGANQPPQRDQDAAPGSESPARYEPSSFAQDPLLKVLAATYDTTYDLSPDGTTYLSPRTLYGVPVNKITESSPYWNRSWKSLDAFLAGEAAEIAAKEASHRLLASDKTNRAYQASYKLHQDNSCKYKKIRELFGANTRYHPNQLVAKRHLPARGLCDMDLMYHVACKLSDLQTLRARGELAMDPFDFLRWRVGLLVDRKFGLGVNVRDRIKSLIMKLGGSACEKDPAAGDVMFRQAVLRAARYEGRDRNFGPKRKSKEASQGGGAGGARVGTARSSTSRSAPLGQAAAPAANAAASTNLGLQLRRDAQKRRRAERAQQGGSTYMGVNGFRAQRASQPET